MIWKYLIITIVVFSTAGWMLFDGSRALIVGEYVTPESGEYAGQIGPWANLVQGFGIEPHSTAMKVIFVLYGLLALAVLAYYLLRYPWGRGGLMGVCFLGLWYLPFGTILNLLILYLLMMPESSNTPRSRYMRRGGSHKNLRRRSHHI